MTKKMPSRVRSTLEDRLRAASVLDAIPGLPGEWLDRFLEDAHRFQEYRERIHLEALAAACREMIRLIPASVADPESVAAETYAIFCRSLGTSYSGQDAKYMGGRLQKAMGILAQPLRNLNHDMAELPEIDYAQVSVEVLKYGMDLNVLVEQLQVLEKVVANVENPNAPGRNKEHNTTAAIAAGTYLMDHGIKRQRAAKIAEVLTQHHPDVDAKDWRTIQAAMKDAGIEAKRRKLGKEGRKQHILLTPG